jgi:hypothetical protein
MEGDPSAEQARKKAESNARMTRLFTVLTLLVGIVTVGTVGYAIYRQPANPQPLGSATVEVVGDVHTTFSGTVGTLTDERTVSGATQLSLEVPYKQAPTTWWRPSSGKDPERLGCESGHSRKSWTRGKLTGPATASRSCSRPRARRTTGQVTRF